MFKEYRKFVDRNLPSLGRTYRLVRDLMVAGQSRQTVYGFTLAGDPTMARADWELEETHVFLGLLSTHDVVVDIGANVGFYSCLAAKHGKHVLSVEPSPRNLKYLNRNLWDNQCFNTEVFPMGLSNHCGLTQIYGFGGMASFVEGWGQSHRRYSEVVSVTTLDTMLSGRFAEKRLLIKMDVEGFELEVLKGAKQTLQRFPKPAWLVEILLADALIPDGVNPDFADTFECFWDAGYDCRTLDGRLELVTPSRIKQWIAAGLRTGKHNYLFQQPMVSSRELLTIE
jgi:FkbM family methyltransferase